MNPKLYPYSLYLMFAFLAFDSVLAVVRIRVFHHRDSFVVFAVFIGAGLDEYILCVHFYSKFLLAVCLSCL